MTPVPDSDERAKAQAEFGAAWAELGDETAPTKAQLDRLAVLAAMVALTAAPTLDHDPRARHMLGWWHYYRYQFLSVGDDKTELERAFRLWEPIFDGTPFGFPPEFVRRYKAPATAAESEGDAFEFFRRYERTGKVTFLDEAIASFRRAVQDSPAGHPGLGGCLSNLGNMLRIRFERGGGMASLDEAIRVARRAGNVSVDHPDRGMYLSNLSNVLRIRFEWAGEVEDLDEAIEVGRHAVQVTLADHPDRGVYLTNLGLALRLRSERVGDVEDLDEAIEVGRRAVQISVDHPNLGTILSYLCTALRTRFERVGDVGDLDEAIEVGRRAVQISVDHPDLAGMLSSFGIALHTRFERVGDVASLSKAIASFRRAVQATPSGDPNLGGYLSNLGGALQARFNSTGKAASLDEAIDVGRQAVRVTSIDDPDLGAYLSNLGHALKARFDRTGEVASLDEAIASFRRAVQVIPADHPALRVMLCSLGSTLRTRFERIGDLASLDEAIDADRRAVQVSASSPDVGMYLSNLSLALRARSEWTADVVSADEAVDVGRRAVDASAKDPGLGGRLNNLAIALQTRFDLTEDETDLVEAIQVGRQAVEVTSADDPDRGAHLSNLGHALQTRFKRTGDVTVLAECRRCYADAWAVESSPANVRVAAARCAVDMDLVADETVHALVMAERAVELLPLLAPRHLQRSDRQHRVTRLTGLASTVAAAALAAGRPERAVELLEQTRGLSITETLDTRSDLTALHDHAPGLAAWFTGVRDALDALDHADSGRPRARYRERLLAEWEQLLARIRAIPEFADFLSTPSIHQLCQAARNGPIVYVVAHAHASHALILTDTPHRPVHAVPLPDITPDKVNEHAAYLRAAHHVANQPDNSARQRITARERIHQILGQIWDTITEPVLTHLGHTTTPTGDQPWPRLWWCPVGTTTYLPLHAAGHHPTTPADGTSPVGGGDTVIDRIVSSYTPTTRALHHTLSSATTSDDPRTLVVAVTDAPDAPALPGVTTEVDHLSKLIPDIRVLPDPDDTTTRDTVLAALLRHDIAHFACHGFADWDDDPTASRLILHDHHTHPLTLDHITALHLTGAQLAYLSACSTTDTNPNHTDEATHLTAAFHLAGYRAVVGTLWPVKDRAATAITTAFYQHLTYNGTTPPDATRAAYALHHATRAYRDNKPKLPDHWITHIHTGH